MDKTKLGLFGAISSLAALPAAAATPSEPAIPPAASYADLLQPIPNATERLKMADLQEAQKAKPRLIKTDYWRREVVWRRVYTRHHRYYRHARLHHRLRNPGHRAGE